MSLNCGIVGLPNVGKSTLFNALTQSMVAEAANYAFCTIEPNTGVVAVPDSRLHKLAALAGSAKTIPNQLQIVDIAGLVKGASQGSGLGNQFLANIRETDAILHVVRCFDGDVEHVEGQVDARRDADIIATELMIADMESLEKRVANLEKRMRGQDKDAKTLHHLLGLVLSGLQQGIPARVTAKEWSNDERALLKQQHLLTEKPVLYVCNIAEDDIRNQADAQSNVHTAAITQLAAQEGAFCLYVSAGIEAEIAQIQDEQERQAFLEDLGVEQSGLERLIFAAYQLLGLITFFTAGPKEARAWTVPKGATAPQAAGAIHTDFERGFIRAETIAYTDYIALGSEQAAKEAGKMRAEGKDYLVKDGDVFHFRFNV